MCCSQLPGVLYIFDNPNLVSYEKHFKFMEDLSFVIYFDSEMTTGNDLFLDKEIYVISYCLIFAFHPKLKMDRIVALEVFNKLRMNFLI